MGKRSRSESSFSSLFSDSSEDSAKRRRRKEKKKKKKEKKKEKKSKKAAEAETTSKKDKSVNVEIDNHAAELQQTGVADPSSRVEPPKKEKKDKKEKREKKESTTITSVLDARAKQEEDYYKALKVQEEEETKEMAELAVQENARHHGEMDKVYTEFKAISAAKRNRGDSDDDEDDDGFFAQPHRNAIGATTAKKQGADDDQQKKQPATIVLPSMPVEENRKDNTMNIVDAVHNTTTTITTATPVPLSEIKKDATMPEQHGEQAGAATTTATPTITAGSTAVVSDGNDSDDNYDDDDADFWGDNDDEVKKEFTKEEVEEELRNLREYTALHCGPNKEQKLRDALKDDNTTTASNSMPNNHNSVGSSNRSLVVFVEDELDAVVNKKVKRTWEQRQERQKKESANAAKAKQLKYVDHSKVQYMEFEKDFYIPPSEVSKLSADEIKVLIKELDGAKVKGREAPRPMRSWTGCGLSDTIMELLKKKNYVNPFAVQCLAMPALMSGRDLLAIAKTGSGKTLSYVLPVVRHASAQRKCGPGEGPICLILVPTHELAAQVYKTAEDFCRASQLRCTASYGGTGLADNIKLCRQGCDVMVATPGRLLDLLIVSGGSVLSLKRCSFVVIDEADRMFDEGFKVLLTAFLKNIQPGRQVALISATMPKEVKKAAEEYLRDPVELSVGGRPSPSSNVHQSIVFFDELVYEGDPDMQQEDFRFARLLQLLSETTVINNNANETLTTASMDPAPEEPLILIFVQNKEDCDQLCARLKMAGYRNLVSTLYSGMDQIDREEALIRFTRNDRRILIATGVAERGIDILDLDLVINYSMPDHYEAYVHRIGRTGRAGKKGKAVSFFTRVRDDDIAPDLVMGLEQASQDLPEELVAIAMQVREKRKAGLASSSSSYARGFKKGKSYKFDSKESKKRFQESARAMGLDAFVSDEDESDEDSDAEVTTKKSDPEIFETGADDDVSQRQQQQSTTALTLYRGGALTLTSQQEDRVAAAKRFAEKITSSYEDPENSNVMCQAEYPVNDFPPNIRSKLLKRDFLRDLAENTQTSITAKGEFFDMKFKHTHRRKEGARDLYLEIRGKFRENITRVFRALDEVIAEAEAKSAKKFSAFGPVKL